MITKKVFIVSELLSDTGWTIRGIFNTRTDAVNALNERMANSPERNDCKIFSFPVGKWVERVEVM